MAFIPVPNTAEVVLHFLLDGQHCANVHHVKFPAVPDQAQLDALAIDVRQWWIASIQPLSPTSLALQEVIVRDISSANGLGVLLPLVNGSGADNNPALPNHVTLAIKWVTGLAGRSFRGRTYYLQLTESRVDGNTVSVGSITAIFNAYTALMTAVNTGGRLLAVVSRYSGVDPVTKKPIPRVGGGIATAITGHAVDSTVDSQRRRLPGRGN